MDISGRMAFDFKRFLMHRQGPHNLIIGVQTVRETLRHMPHKVLRVYLETPRGQKKRSEIVHLCEQHGIAQEYLSFEALTRMAQSDSHQSVAALIQDRVFIDAKHFLQQVEEKERSLVLMVDQIFDPQNFGSLIRSAECLGADAIIWSKNRGTEITPSVAKAACGASEILPLMRVANLDETLRLFQKAGFEGVASLLNERSENAFSFRFAEKTVLIIGSEGEGIQPLLQSRADRSIYIPMQGKIESLNAAQAASLLMGLYQRGRY